MTLSAVWEYGPDVVIFVASGIVLTRVLLALHRRVAEHAERIAHLEGRAEINPDKESEE